MTDKVVLAGPIGEEPSKEIAASSNNGGERIEGDRDELDQRA